MKLSHIKTISFLIFLIIILCGSNNAIELLLFFSKSSLAFSKPVPSLNYELLIKLHDHEKVYKIRYLNNDILDFVKVLAARPEIEHVEPNYLFEASYMPSDPLYNEQWYLERTQTPQAWDMVGAGGEDIVVAVIDTGVNIDHPDLKNNIWINQREVLANGIDDDKNGYIDDYYGWDFVRNSPDPRPKFDETYNPNTIHHGTIVSGIVAAVGDNREGIAGMAWKTKIMSLRALNSEGTGSLDHVIKAVNYAKNNGAKIINLSFVGTNRSEILAEALKEAWRSGVIIVAAAGNEATGQTENLDFFPSYPICLDAGDPENYIIGIGATDQQDRKASFSNYGSKCIDLMAPGTRFYSTLSTHPSINDYKQPYGGYWSGTSVAVPVVSGAAALIKSLNPLLTNHQIRDILFDNADNIDYINPDLVGKMGYGRLNVYRAVNYVYIQLLQAPQARYIVTAAGPGGGPHIRIMKSNGLAVGGFMAYESKFRGGIRVATGDVDGDGQEEIIAVPAGSRASEVKIFSSSGNLKNNFLAFKNYRQGLNVSSCDLDGDSISEIIITPNGGIEPTVLVFTGQGQIKNKFLAYNKYFRGAVKSACGDVDDDGENEVVIGSGAGGGPQVRIFGPSGTLEVQWFAFLEKFRGGISLAVGDVNYDGRAEIIAGIASGASSYLRIFDYFGFLQTQFLTYDRNYLNGINLAVSDLNDDGVAEIVTGVNRSVPSHVRIFDYLGASQGGFFAYDRKFLGGVNVAIIKGEEQ